VARETIYRDHFALVTMDVDARRCRDDARIAGYLLLFSHLYTSKFSVRFKNARASRIASA